MAQHATVTITMHVLASGVLDLFGVGAEEVGVGGVAGEEEGVG